MKVLEYSRFLLSFEFYYFQESEGEKKSEEFIRERTI